jgi:hypothetical protein
MEYSSVKMDLKDTVVSVYFGGAEYSQVKETVNILGLLKFKSN